MSEVFAGLVTHARSSFNADGAATAQLDALAAGLRERGLSVDTIVSDRDDYDAARWPLTRGEIARSAVSEVLLEHRWRRYLAAGGGRPARPGWWDAMVTGAMLVRRVARARRAMCVRLVNIDLSHLRVMTAAQDAGARWTLILEDDARASDVDAVAARLADLLPLLEASDIEFVNLSESLPLSTLRVEGIIGGPALPDGPAWLVGARRPVTNTVCATLYRDTLLREIRTGIEDRGLVPVVPIDWRVNEQVMRLVDDRRMGPQSCAWVRPGPFLQGSMHAG